MKIPVGALTFFNIYSFGAIKLCRTNLIISKKLSKTKSFIYQIWYIYTKYGTKEPKMGQNHEIVF